MEFNTQICTTREQSERLLAMGLNPETADMIHFFDDGDDYPVYHRWICRPWKWDEEDLVDSENIPAWSLHRLWVINNDIYCELSISDTFDCMIDEIEDKVRHGLLNKEYLMK